MSAGSDTGNYFLYLKQQTKAIEVVAAARAEELASDGAHGDTWAVRPGRADAIRSANNFSLSEHFHLGNFLVCVLLGKEFQLSIAKPTYFVSYKPVCRVSLKKL